MYVVLSACLCVSFQKNTNQKPTTPRCPSISNNFFSTFCVWRNTFRWWWFVFLFRWFFSLSLCTFCVFLGQRLKIWNTIASLEPVSRHTLGRSSPPYQVLWSAPQRILFRSKPSEFWCNFILLSKWWVSTFPYLTRPTEWIGRSLD